MTLFFRPALLLIALFFSIFGTPQLTASDAQAMSRVPASLSTAVDGCFSVDGQEVTDASLHQRDAYSLSGPDQEKSVASAALLQALRERSGLVRQGLTDGHSDKLGAASPYMRPFPWEPSTKAVCYDVVLLEQDIASMMREYTQVAMWAEDEEDSLLDRFGNKHKNLIKMARIVDDLQLEGVVVPKPRGIASEAIEELLRVAAPEVFESWATLQELYDRHQAKDFFQAIPESTQHLKAIDSAIDKAFTSTDGSFLPEEVPHWLEELRQKGSYLMVRSSGAEDSKELANAGGNASVAYVEPSVDAVLNPIGMVVRSYFSVNSLQNRINAGRNPFAEELRLSVTLQELVGEPVGGATALNEIPKSLVLFSNEPLYVGDEAFRVLRISGTYGHGDGVVGNFGIASDTVLVLNSLARPDQLYIVYDRQHKAERLVPHRKNRLAVWTDVYKRSKGFTEMTPLNKGDITRLTRKVALHKRPNTPEMAEAALLDTDEIIRLYQLAVVTEAFFDDTATDMEIVIKDGEICSVQARSVNRPQQLPTYIDMQAVAKLESSPIIESSKLEVLVPGLSSVIQFLSSEELLISTTLEEAERQFISGVHKAVVVGQPEPANSHPVVNFSALGIPCFFVTDLRRVEDVLQHIDGEHQAFICVQGSRFYIWDLSVAPPSEYIREGYATHPANVAFSFPGDLAIDGPQSILPEEVQTLLTTLRYAPTHERALEMVEELAAHPWINRVSEERLRLTELAADFDDLPGEVLSSLRMLENLEDAVEHSFEEIQAYFSRSESDQRLQPLFHIKVLEALLYAPNRRPLGQGQLCLADVDSISHRVQEMIDYRAEIGAAARMADLLHHGSQSLTEQGYSEWRNLLLELERAELTQEEETAFREYLDNLQMTKSLPFMMTFVLPQINQGQFAPQEKLERLLATLTAADTVLIRTVLSFQQDIDKLVNDLDAFADPTTFDRAWTGLQQLSEALRQSVFILNYRSASSLGRAVSLRCMVDLVDVFDRSIKSVKASPLWWGREKVRRIREMLHPYFELLEAWVTHLVPHDRIATHENWPVKRYIEHIQDFMFQRFDEGVEQLMPTPEFSVAAAVLGSRVEFSRHYPGTLEDLFTLIHQNLLASMGMLNMDLISVDMLEQAHLPELLKESDQKLRATREFYAECVSVDVTEHGARLQYNVPLRNHSGQLTLVYDKYADAMILQFLLLGEARGRWDLVAELALLKHISQEVPLDKPIFVSAQELRVSWRIPSADSLARALNMVTYLAREISMEHVYDLDEHYRCLVDEHTPEELLRRIVAHGSIHHPWETKLLSRIVAQIIQRGDNIEIVGDFLDYGLVSDGWAVDSPLLESLHSLVSMDRGFEAAAEIARRGVFDNSIFIRSDAYRLFQELFTKGHGWEAAIEAANRGVAGSNYRFVREIALNLYISLVEHGHGFETAVKAARDSVLDEDLYVREPAMKLFQVLFEKGYGFEAASEAAKKAVFADDFRIRDGCALDLFKALMEKEQGQQAVLDIAELSVFDDDVDVKNRSTALLEELFRRGYGVEAVGEVLGRGMLAEDFSVRYNAGKLLENLYDTGYGLEAAAEAADRGMLDDDVNIRERSLILLETVVGKGHGLETAIRAAERGVLDDHPDVKKRSLRLFKAVADRGFGLEAALKAAQRGLPDDDFIMELESFKLLQTVVQQGHGVETAEQFVAQGIFDESISTQRGSLDLFKVLLQEGHSVETAEQLAARGVLDEEYRTRSVSLDLFKVLFQEGHSVETAEQLAARGMLDGDWSRRYYSLNLFKALFTNGYGFEAAAKTAERGVSDRDSFVRSHARELFQALVEKSHDVDAAAKAVSRLQADPDFMDRVNKE